MAAVLPRLCALVLPFLAVATGLDVPSHGCYWSGCQNKWFGICAAGHFLDSQSDNCDGLCTESKSPPCLPLHTHFYCCIPGTPRVTNKCGHCKNKVDFGKEFICCSDCSNPTFMNKDSKLGYCKSGAELTMQLKPQETFHWVAGPWMEYSSPCDGGVRYHDVACYGSLADATIKHYPVDSGGGRKKNEVGRIESNTIQAPPTLSTPEFARRWLPPARRPPPATPSRRRLRHCLARQRQRHCPPVAAARRRLRHCPARQRPAPLPTGGCHPPAARRQLRPGSSRPGRQGAAEAGSREQSRVYIYID